MAQYMIIRGAISPKGRTTNPVAIKSNNNVLEITGKADAVNYWSKMLAKSLTLAQSFKKDELLFQSYASANSMVDILVFDNLKYEEFKEEFEGIKGVRRTVKITRVPDIDDEDYSKEKVRDFVRKTRNIK
jgi:hypothetical protein